MYIKQITLTYVIFIISSDMNILNSVLTFALDNKSKIALTYSLNLVKIVLEILLTIAFK